jgi:uncharacterized protein
VNRVLLAGIVGSTAYGLSGPDSDVDRLGVFAAPTVAFHGLTRPVESIVTTRPDRTLHEAAKWLRLALHANPTVTELVWLPDNLYEVRTAHGDELIAVRGSLASAPRVRQAYLGYAAQQFGKLRSRTDRPADAATRRRVAKHARHLMRLCHQGLQLYRTGEVEIRLADPQSFVDFGDRVAGGDLGAAERLLAGTEAAFDAARSPLPQEPDHRPGEDWLLRLRAAHLDTATPAPGPDSGPIRTERT